MYLGAVHVKIEGFLSGSVGKNLPAKQETWVWPWVGKILWRRKWQLIPAFLSGKSHGQRSRVGSMGSQRIRHDLVTKQKQQHKDLGFIFKVCVFFFLRGPFLKSLLNLLQYHFCFMFWFFGCEMHGILAPQPGTELAIHAVVQLLRVVWLFVTPWTAAHQASVLSNCLLKCAQTHVPWVGDGIQPFHPLSPPSPLALNLSQHQSLFQWISSSHQVAKVLDLQLQHQSLQ